MPRRIQVLSTKDLETFKKDGLMLAQYPEINTIRFGIIIIITLKTFMIYFT